VTLLIAAQKPNPVTKSNSKFPMSISEDSQRSNMKPTYPTQILGSRLGLAINGLGDFWSKIFMCIQQIARIIQRSICMHGLWLLRGCPIPSSLRIILTFQLVRKRSLWKCFRFQLNV